MSPELVTVLGSAVGALVQGIMSALQSNDVSTLEALAKACPRPEVLALRDAALVKQQRDLAERELSR